AVRGARPICLVMRSKPHLRQRRNSRSLSDCGGMSSQAIADWAIILLRVGTYYHTLRLIGVRHSMLGRVLWTAIGTGSGDLFREVLSPLRRGERRVGAEQKLFLCVASVLSASQR